MTFELEINGRVRQVVVRRDSGRHIVMVDGREWLVDAARVDAQSLSLVVIQGGTGRTGGTDTTGGTGGNGGTGGRSVDVSVVPDGPAGQLSVRVGTAHFAVQPNRRHGRRRGADSAAGGGGPQRLAAPMPGKVVRILAAKGDRVHARQPIVVVEAMKMENELRAACDSVVAEILVAEGQLVEAGMQLAVLDAVQGR